MCYIFPFISISLVLSLYNKKLLPRTCKTIYEVCIFLALVYLKHSNHDMIVVYRVVYIMKLSTEENTFNKYRTGKANCIICQASCGISSLIVDTTTIM